MVAGILDVCCEPGLGKGAETCTLLVALLGALLVVLGANCCRGIVCVSGDMDEAARDNGGGRTPGSDPEGTADVPDRGALVAVLLGALIGMVLGSTEPIAMDGGEQISTDPANPEGAPVMARPCNC